MFKKSPCPAKPDSKEEADLTAVSHIERKRELRQMRAAAIRKKRRIRIFVFCGAAAIIAAASLIGYALWIHNSQPGPFAPLSAYLSSMPEAIPESNKRALTPDIPAIDAMEYPSNVEPEDFDALREQARSNEPVRMQAYALLANMDTFNDAELMKFYSRGSDRFGFVSQKDRANRDPNLVAPLTESLESIPHLLQWDTRWGYVPYGYDAGKQLCIYYTGCAPTCMSMIASYLKQDSSLTPSAMCEISNAYGDYNLGTSTSFFYHACEQLGLNLEELGQDENALRSALEQGHPVIINVGEGDFTTYGHFIVASGIENDQIRILDPNSHINSRLWSFEDILRQTKNMWSFWNPNGVPNAEADDSSDSALSVDEQLS